MKAKSLSSGAAKGLAMAVYGTTSRGPCPISPVLLAWQLCTARCWAVSYCPDMNYWELRFRGFMSWKRS